MIKVGIYGYGHLGRGVELALRGAPDMEPAAIFTRRPPDEVRPVTENLPVLSENTLGLMAQRLDVVILCGSSADALPVPTPACAALVDVYKIQTLCCTAPALCGTRWPAYRWSWTHFPSTR